MAWGSRVGSPIQLSGARGMEYVKADDIFREARCYLEGATPEGGPHPRDLARSERLLHELYNHNWGSHIVLYTLGSLYLARGDVGLAATLLQGVTNSHPEFGEAWNNLGLAFRDLGMWKKSVYCTERASKLIQNPDIPCNLSGLHITRNMPEKALEYAEQALAVDPDHIKSQWHKALALLEMRKWDEAWDWHETRLKGGANEDIAHRNYHGEEQTPVWDGKTKGKLVIHGEQGLGDEIMFASCIPDAIATGCEIVFEPAPRMGNVFKRAFPAIAVYGTHKADGREWVAKHGKPDFKIALGSLPKFYRRSASAFPGTPFLKPDKAKAKWWGQKLHALGRKPNIGVAWQGGVQSTRFDARSFHPSTCMPMFSVVDANWISLQYDITAKSCVEDMKRAGVEIHHWPRAVEQYDPETKVPNDMDELIALVSKLDLVVTVCQTVVHVAGALGVPCFCLTPSEPSWRYGAGDATDMPWYNSVRQFRQDKGTTDWAPVVDSVAIEVNTFLNTRKTAWA